MECFTTFFRLLLLFTRHSDSSRIPEEIRANGFGLRLSALTSYLAGRCQDGRRLVEEFVEDVLGVPMSLGTMSEYEAEMAAALAPAYEQVAVEVQAAKSRNVDETGWGKDWEPASDRRGKRRWLWAGACKTCAFFAIHAGRSWESRRTTPSSKLVGRSRAFAFLQASSRPASVST